MMQLNFFKKAIVVIALCVGFWCYRTPAMFHYFVSEIPQYSISLPIFTFLGTHWFEGRFEKSITKLEKKRVNLKTQMKDTEKLLVERLDPDIYKTLKRIVMKEESAKLESLKLHEMGCSEKCRVKNLCLELDMQRNAKIVDVLKTFVWCNECAEEGQTGAVRTSVCKEGCGRRVMVQCRPLIKSYA